MRRPSRQPELHARAPLPAPQPVGPERLDALARHAVSKLSPRDRVAVVFDPQTLEAEFLCVGCDEGMRATRAGWFCGGCSYRLESSAAAELVGAHREALDALLGGARRTDVAMVPAAKGPPVSVWKGVRAWLVAWLSRS